jgi:hypothetical protein
MSKVYVIQNTHKLNRDTSVLEPKYDFSSAARFGELVYLLTPNAKPHDPSVIKELKEKLQTFSNDDHLLLVGNPALIGFACAVAADWNEGRLSVLQWDGKKREYVAVRADLYCEPEWKETWAR